MLEFWTTFGKSFLFQFRIFNIRGDIITYLPDITINPNHRKVKVVTNVILKNMYRIMNKGGVILIFIIFFISFTDTCQGQKNEIELLRNFNGNFFLSDSLNLEKIYPFLDLHSTLKNSNDFTKMIDYVHWSAREAIEKDALKYEIKNFASYKELSVKHPNLTSKKVFYKLAFRKKENVFFGINKDNNEICIAFVVKKNKIISFFPYINIGTDSIRPFLLNKKLGKKQEEYITVFNKYIGI